MKPATNDTATLLQMPDLANHIIYGTHDAGDYDAECGGDLLD